MPPPEKQMQIANARHRLRQTEGQVTLYAYALSITFGGVGDGRKHKNDEHILNSFQIRADTKLPLSNFKGE